jgi:hypothetical protein
LRKSGAAKRRSGSRVEGGNICRKEEDCRLITLIICGLFEKPL